MKFRDIRCNPPPSSTKPGSGWSANKNRSWNGRAHFFGAAAEAMRRILIENARRQPAARYGGGLAKLHINAIEIAAAAKDDELLWVHEALEKLAIETPVVS